MYCIFYQLGMLFVILREIIGHYLLGKLAVADAIYQEAKDVYAQQLNVLRPMGTFQRAF